MSKLVIVVPAGRRRCGRCVLLGDAGSTRMAPFRILATASKSVAERYGNADRDWRRPFGHTPTGTYVVAGSLPPGVMPKPRKRWWRFGRFGALILSPVGGNALIAARSGRTRFLLHGGIGDSLGRLRPTFGGLRVSDRNLRTLIAAVNAAYADGDPVSSVEVAETSTPSWLDDGRPDQAGRLRPAVDGPAPSPNVTGSRVTGSVSVTRAALIALGFGMVGRRAKKRGAGKLGEVDRRDFVGLAFLTIGSLGTSGCSPADDPVPDSKACHENPCKPLVNEDGSVDGESESGFEGGGGGDDGGGPDGGYDARADAPHGEGGRPEGGAAGTGGGATGGTGDVATGDVGTGDVITGDVGTGDIGTGDVGTGDVGTGDGTGTGTGDGTGGGG